MNKLIFLILCMCFAFIGSAQVELRTDGILLPGTNSKDVTAPEAGYLIYDRGAVPAVYNGTEWQYLQNLIFQERTSSIVYSGDKPIGIGVSSPESHFHVNAPDGINPFRIQANGSTKFVIFDNGAMSFGTNWNNPEVNTFRINTAKTIINDELVMADNSFSLVEGEGIKMYNASGEATIAINADLNGDGRVMTNELELTGGSDFSENFNVSTPEGEVIEPGYVVSVGLENGTIQLCDQKRDKKVIGIVSGANGIQTGLIMGQKGSIADGSIPVALSGRTYVYTTNENGPIEPGDFLTSSSTPGYAMKVKRMKKAQGAIIGKALTSLDTKEGFVLVLVNLQ